LLNADCPHMALKFVNRLFSNEMNVLDRTKEFISKNLIKNINDATIPKKTSSPSPSETPSTSTIPKQSDAKLKNSPTIQSGLGGY